MTRAELITKLLTLGGDDTPVAVDVEEEYHDVNGVELHSRSEQQTSEMLITFTGGFTWKSE